MDGVILFLLPIAVLITITVVIVASANRRRATEEQRQRERAEEQRLEACGKVVVEFANYLGYIARQVISRTEIDRLIDSGLSSDELSSEIARRIDAAEGLVLGYHGFGETRIPVKLTQDFRDRHLYIVGKSGSGKTNLIRNLVLQDLHA